MYFVHRTLAGPTPRLLGGALLAGRRIGPALVLAPAATASGIACNYGGQ